MSLKVLALNAENYKRLRAVEIVPDGNVVTISGRNAAGKTSVLDAIWAALAGADASRATQQPIREGQETAVVRLDLGEYIVTRRWTKDDAGTLTVESSDHAKYSSPQALLDQIVGKRSFDPLAFIRQDKAKQRATLIAALGDSLPFDPNELDAERKGVYDARTDAGRDVKKLEGQLSAFPSPDPELPAEEISTRSLLDKMSDVNAKKAARAQLEHAVQRAGDSIERAKEAVARADRAVEEAQRVRRDALSNVVNAELEAADLREQLALLPEYLGDAEADLLRKVDDLERTNQRIRAEKDRRQLAAELSGKKSTVAAHTIKLAEIDRRKADGIAAANPPVPGLSFDDNGVTYNGIPFSQASNAEQLRVSTALAMSFNPTLRVLRIDNGESLDSDSLQIIKDLAAEQDFQVWLSVVSEDRSIGVVIEDGSVAA